MTRHAQVTVDGPWGEPIPVDAGMVGLLLAAWAAGASTMTSCEEGEDGAAYVAFGNLLDLQVFVKLLGADLAEYLDVRGWVEGTHVCGQVSFPPGMIEEMTERFGRYGEVAG